MSLLKKILEPKVWLTLLVIILISSVVGVFVYTSTPHDGKKESTTTRSTIHQVEPAQEPETVPVQVQAEKSVDVTYHESRKKVRPKKFRFFAFLFEPEETPPDPSACSFAEYKGEGPQGTDAAQSRKVWKDFKDLYHGLKAKYSLWLKEHKSDLTERAYEVMNAQINSLQIIRPIVEEEPDLTWRGVGVFTRGPDNNPLIRIGSGFLNLFRADQKRAAFELSRLLAQAWAPCEIARLLGPTERPWLKLVECLGLTYPALSPQGCVTALSGEVGWAVSTALAVQISPPGCTVPAFSEPAVAACVKKIPLNRDIASINFNAYSIAQEKKAVQEVR